MSKVYMSPVQRNGTREFRRTTNESTKSGSKASSLPELLTYDIHEDKTPQQLLYESAQATSRVEAKWEDFINEFKEHELHKDYNKLLVKHLDDTKQWAALHYAVFHGNEYVFNLLTNKQSMERRFLCDVNILTGNGENALHIAARSPALLQPSLLSSRKSIEPLNRRDEDTETLSGINIVDRLIILGIDINHADDEGRTPLHLAVMANHVPLVQCLLKRRVNLYAKSKLFLNVLHFAFIPIGQTSAQLSEMWNFLKNKLHLVSKGSAYGRRNRQTNLALMRDIDGRTPLVFALCHPQIERKIIKELLESMTDDSDYLSTQTQLFIAIERVAKQLADNFDVLIPILDVFDDDTFNQSLHFPCRHNNRELLRWLIESTSRANSERKSQGQTFKTIDLNAKDHAGYTPLLTAAFYSSTKCVEYLQSYFNTNARANTTAPSLFINLKETNNDGENILHICAKHGQSETVFNMIWDLAVKLGLPEQKDSSGNLPLHAAAENNQKMMYEKFLTYMKSSNKSLLSVRNNQGQTAAHVAVTAKPHRIGPERHFAGKHEKGKHHHSKTSNEKEEDDDDEHDFGLPIIELSCEKGSKDDQISVLSEMDDDGKTCLHLAAENGHLKIVKHLVRVPNSQIDVIADRRLTPLHLACKNGHREIIAYLIENGALPTLRNSELHNALEIAIVNQNEGAVEELLTLPNWRDLMRNAQPIDNSEGYDTPMRKLIRYLPNTAVWMIEKKLTRTLGGQGKHVFKKVYDYEFYMDIYSVKQWYRQNDPISEENETFCERWHRRGCTAIYYTECCCCPVKEETNSQTPYTDDAYTLIRNHPLFIASEQSQCPALVDHPYNTFLRGEWYRQDARFYYIVRAISFILYATFLAIWTAIILLGKHPQYFYAKVGRNLTNDLDSCANVSRILTANNDSEALKTTAYKNLKISLYAFLIFFVVENVILIFALFPRIFRTLDYILEISTFVFTFVYIYDWTDWQNPVVFRCPIQYQIGSMGMLIAWLGLLTYVKRSTWFDMGVFVAMIQVIGYKFIRFIPVLLVIVCGFGFTNWMLLQNQDVFQDPVQAVVRTGLLMFELNYEDHLYNSTIYYQIIFFMTSI